MNKGFDEGKFKLDGIEMPFQCILLNVPKYKKERPEPHYHDYIEILYSISTDSDIYINGRRYCFKTGDLAIINAKEDHEVYFDRSDAHYVVIKLLPEVLYTGEQTVFEMKYLLPFIIVDSKHERVINVDGDDNFIHDTVTNIMYEWNRREYGFELAIRADILRIFLWVLRHWQKNNIDALDRFDYSDDMIKTVQSVTEYVSENYSTATAKAAAEYCNLSYSYFSRSFKRVMNQSFTEYLNYVRITKAEQLLSTTDKSISEIADEVGFSTASYFIEQFKKYKQKSPKQYRLGIIDKM